VHALAIAGANIGPKQALPVRVPCVMVFIPIAMAYLTWRGRRAAPAVPAAAPPRRHP